MHIYADRSMVQVSLDRSTQKAQVTHTYVVCTGRLLTSTGVSGDLENAYVYVLVRYTPKNSNTSTERTSIEQPANSP